MPCIEDGIEGCRIDIDMKFGAQSNWTYLGYPKAIARHRTVDSNGTFGGINEGTVEF